MSRLLWVGVEDVSDEEIENIRRDLQTATSNNYDVVMVDRDHVETMSTDEAKDMARQLVHALLAHANANEENDEDGQ